MNPEADVRATGIGLANESTLLRRFLESTQDVVFFKDRESRFRYVSDSLAAGIGLDDPQEMLGKTDFDFFDRAFAEKTLADEQRIIETGEPLQDIQDFVTLADGRSIHLTTCKMPLLDADGAVVGVFGVARDETNRKLAETALHEQTERLARIVDMQRAVASASVELSSVLELVCERAQELAGAPGARILMIEGDRFRFRAASGYIADQVGSELPIEGTFSGWVHRHGRSVVIHDTSADPRSSGIATLHGIGSLVAVPLIEQDMPVGVLNVVSPDTQAFTLQTAHTLELVSVVVSSALARAREFDAKQAELEALASFRTTFQSAPIGIIRVGIAGAGDLGRVDEANPAFEHMLGYTTQELGGIGVDQYTHPDDRDVSLRAVRDMVAGRRDGYRLEKRMVRKDGTVIWTQVQTQLVRDPDGRPAFAISMIEDITMRKFAEEALVRQSELNRHQALHDELTGLANRTLFRDRIERAIASARRDGTDFAVLMLDVDRFKEINDSLGHHTGDALLSQLAGRLNGVLRDSDTIARLGGDEFGLLLADISERSQVTHVVEKIAGAVEQPFLLQGLPLSVEASAGAAFFPLDGTDPDTLLRHADVAMYRAKESDTSCAFYEATQDVYDPARLTLVGELRDAIESRALVLHYQPITSLETGQIHSVEALLRWNHPWRGTILPDQFLPLLQQTGLLKPLTLYVIDEALRQSTAWRADGLELPIAINLSPRNLLDVELPRDVHGLLEQWDADPATIELELTESTMVADPARSKLVLEELASIGIRLAIDDYGSGYSSLGYLTRLPISAIKIDRSFVMTMARDEGNATIVRSTIELARNLGLDIVAEGVEAREVWHRLRALGCTYAQGYYIAPPQPASELRNWLLEHRRLGPVAETAA